MKPGETDDQWFEIHNPSDADVNFSVGSRWLLKQGEWTNQFTSQPTSSEPIEWEEDNPVGTTNVLQAPHYLWNVTDARSGIDRHAGRADQRPVRPVRPCRFLRPDADQHLARLRLRLDRCQRRRRPLDDDNGDGVVQADELDDGEYIRFNYGYNASQNNTITVQSPRQRASDGIFLGLIHEQARVEVPQTNINMLMEFYEQTEWDWVQPYSTELPVAAGGSNRVRVTATVPGDAPHGLYEGALWFNDGTWNSIVPVTINVAGDSNLEVGMADDDTLGCRAVLPQRRGLRRAGLGLAAGIGRLALLLRRPV